MSTKDKLGQRMKQYYEDTSKTRLVRRMPVAIRIDGKAFHTFTKGFARPYDATLARSMWDTMQYLCRNIQGCVLGYQQSDEITLILVDYKTLESQAWFDYKVQKLCSVSASMATMAFNKAFERNTTLKIDNDFGTKGDAVIPYAHLNALRKGAVFDSRAFNIPIEEVTNLIYWRQLDAIRNSIQMNGQYYFSPKELHGKNNEQIKEMLKEKGIDWDCLPSYEQRGVCCIDVDGVWCIDPNIPLFKDEGREYIEKLIHFKEDKQLVSEKYQFPEITPKMHREMTEWYRTHNEGKCAKGNHGAIGGNVKFEILPTSIGDFITVKCSCGCTLDFDEV